MALVSRDMKGSCDLKMTGKLVYLNCTLQKGEPMFENILLAVDGSEHSLHAARVASALAQAMKSQTLRIVVAFEPIPVHLGEPFMQETINARLREAEAIAQKAVETVGAI